MSVCQTITVESLDVGSHTRYISRGWGSSSHMKVIGAHRVKVTVAKQVENSFLPVKFRSAITPVHIEHRAVTFAYSMGFSVMAGRMV